MNYCCEKHSSSTSKPLRLELYDRGIETHLYVLRDNVASAMSSFIEALSSDVMTSIGSKRRKAVGQ